MCLYQLQYLMKLNKVIVLSKIESEKSIKEELAEDIVSIIHSFSGKLYCMRKTVKDKVIKELE